MCYSFVFFALSLDRESFEANPILLKQKKAYEEIADDDSDDYGIQLELFPAKRLHRILRMNPKD